MDSLVEDPLRVRPVGLQGNKSLGLASKALPFFNRELRWFLKIEKPQIFEIGPW